MHRDEFFITAVDGAPDIEAELKTGKSMIKASASQDPYTMAGMALRVRREVLKGEKPRSRSCCSTRCSSPVRT